MNTDKIKTKSLYELGEEYMIQADILTMQISSLRKKIRSAGTLKEELGMKARLAMLYRQRDEVAEIAETLCSYYNKGGKAA